MVDLHWTPREFWQAYVPEFWAAIDFIAERNLDQEDELERIRASSSRNSRGHRGNGQSAAPDDGPSSRRWNGELADAINPDMRLQPRPGWFQWREELRASSRM